MEQALPGASVSDRYREHIEEPRLPDPKDRHVLAAAVEAEARVIVTFNPPEALRPRGIRALHPDALIGELTETTPEGVLEAMRIHRYAQRKPPISSEEYPEILRGARLLKRSFDVTPTRLVVNLGRLGPGMTEKLLKQVLRHPAVGKMLRDGVAKQCGETRFGTLAASAVWRTIC